MLRILTLALFLIGSVCTAQAQTCGNTAPGFPAWLSAFKKKMLAEGISKRAVAVSLNGLTYDTKVMWLDRNQKSFKQSFEVFYKRRTQGMVVIGRRKMKTYAKTFAAIEKAYGVPPVILTAVWGLETSFGHFMGDKSIMRSLATLSYDCRRSEFFTKELVAALQIVERGDLVPKEMVGAWAGEIGQTQFLATRYVDYAVSFDGDKKRDLYKSVPDALASTAAWFKGNGWQSGEPWGEGTVNYDVIKKWNKATVYQRTISTLADELANAKVNTTTRTKKKTESKKKATTRTTKKKRATVPK